MRSLNGDTDTVSLKKLVRKDILKRRRALSAEERNEYSREILERLYKAPFFQKANIIMAYAPMKDEVRLFPLFDECLKSGKELAIPLITGKERMEAVHVPSMDALVEGAYGILTVSEKNRQLISPELIDCIIVPGAAFSLKGERLGLGAGYYDRFLERCSNAARIALAFSCQVTDELPVEPHDATMDMLITETVCMKFREMPDAFYQKKGFETVAKR